MSDAAKTIQTAIDEVRVFDPHCHLRSAHPWAGDLADIVLYHHVWIEMVSSGMGQFEVTKAGMPHELEDPEMPSLERLRRSLPYLPNIRNTTAGLLLRWILEELYGLPGELTEKNMEEACRVVEERAQQSGWHEHVLRERCRIDASITVERTDRSCPERMYRAREWAPFNIAGGKREPQEILSSFEKRFGRPIQTVADYEEFVAASLKRLSVERLRFLGLWVLPYASPECSSPEDVDAILRKVRAKEPLSQTAIGGFCYFGLRTMLEALRKSPLRTIQMIVGAEVLPPHRSIPCWNGNFTGAIGRIAGEFEDFHFNMSTASDLYTQDLGILAKHVPNISVVGYWWHTLYPFYIRKSIETRIDMVPMNKIVAFLSDAYHIEWCYPKLKMVKALWAEVLSERVARGWMEVETAMDLIQAAFWDNPARVYGGV